jgi:toxin FitB
MRIFDSNLLIYSAQDQYAFLRNQIYEVGTCLSAASKIETLGFHKLTDTERDYFETIFRTVPVYSITDEIVEKAVDLRRTRKMSIGDAIIGATALLNGFELHTRNTADFMHIPDLVVINPLDS